MANYESAVRTTLVTASANAPLAAFRAGADAAYLREMHLWYVTAPTTSGALALTRSTAIGTGTLTSLVGQPMDPSYPAGVGQVVTNWGTAVPTLTTTALIRRWIAGAAAIGTGIIWVWEPPGMYVPANAAVNSELVLINLTANAPGTLDMTCVWNE